MASPSASFLRKRIWQYRRSGCVIVFLGMLAALTQVGVIGLLKPSMDILFTPDVDAMVGGLTWLSESQQLELKSWISEVLLPDRMRTLYGIVTIICIVALVNLIVSSSHRFMASMLSRTFYVDLYRDLYEKILSFPVIESQKRKQGDVMSRFSTDIQFIEIAMLDFYQVLFREPFFVLFAMSYCFGINWKLTLLALSIFPVIGIVVALLSKRIHRLSVKESQEAGQLYHQVAETFGALGLIKIFQSEKILLKKLYEISERYLTHIRKIIKIQSLTSPFIDFLASLAIALILLSMAPFVFSGKMGSGDLISILMMLSMIYKPVKAISNAVQKLSRSMAGTNRLMELFSVDSEDDGGNLDFPKEKVRIEFKDLSFSYLDDEKVLESVSLKIEEGQTVALVGPSGAGKTTLMNLLPRLYPCSQGSLLLNDKPVQDYAIGKLRSHIALVSQDVFLFHDTVRHNLTMGEQYSQEEIENATQAASAHDFIQKLTEGYETWIGERGARLSGGQCQRIAIARAILKNPKILLLDEATSALDTQTESEVQKAMMDLAKDRTTLVIAHRLSTVQNADLIVVMQKGKIVESGKHEELLERGELYHRLYHSDLEHSKA